MDYDIPTHYDISTPTTHKQVNELREQNAFTPHTFITPTTMYNSELNVLYLPPKGTLNHPLREEAASVTKMKPPVLQPKQKIVGRTLCTKVNTTYYRMRSARQNRMT